MNLHRMITSVLGLAVATALAAQTPNTVDLRLGLMNTQGDARTMTLKPWGTALEAGLTLSPEGYGVDLRPYVGLIKTNGKENVTGRINYNLQAMHAGLDVIYKPFDTLPIKVFLGPSLHMWSIERKLAVINDELVPSEEPVGERGAKMSFRIGATYDINDKWSVNASFTQSEWRSSSEHENAVKGGIWETGFNPGRPAYFLVTAGYKF